jgi:hypothetical protein
MSDPSVSMTYTGWTTPGQMAQMGAGPQVGGSVPEGVLPDGPLWSGQQAGPGAMNEAIFSSGPGLGLTGAPWDPEAQGPETSFFSGPRLDPRPVPSLISGCQVGGAQKKPPQNIIPGWVKITQQRIGRPPEVINRALGLALWGPIHPRGPIRVEIFERPAYLAQPRLALRVYSYYRIRLSSLAQQALGELFPLVWYDSARGWLLIRSSKYQDNQQLYQLIQAYSRRPEPGANLNPQLRQAYQKVRGASSQESDHHLRSYTLNSGSNNSWWGQRTWPPKGSILDRTFSYFGF